MAPSPAPEAAAPSRAISCHAVYGWCLVLACLEWLYYRLGQQPLRQIGDLPHVISVLEVIEIAMIVRLIGRERRDAPFQASEAALTLAAMAFCVLVLRQVPLAAALALALLAAWRLRKRPSCRASSVALLAFTAQFVLLGWPFLVLHNVVGLLDAAIVRTALQTAGQDVSGHGTYILRPADAIGFDVMWGCASSTTLVQNLTAYAIIAVGLGGPLRRSDSTAFLLVTGATLALNWLRLVLICASKDGYLTWHEGTGANILAAFYAVLILVLAYYRARPRQMQPSA
ncbi:hypothetical protein C5L14_01145 [Labrys okinawensis]|uniref:Exosortase/archaeosortase family protein n=1 Tax=Labrys okinawensis TaxID=346911 RepID=A0A2S9QIU9_9HYPH|nr:hypothetical protein [Labrys okinawensis]PRH89230.1 hypothetical protein C5L14_01145 [Labrys okinawensis]